MLRYDTASFQGGGRLKLHFRCWRPGDGNLRVALVSVSGIGHDLSPHTTAYLVSRGYAIYGFHHRERERVPGQRGFMEEWGRSVEDVRIIVQLVQQQEPGLPIFLLGIGTGAELARACALHHPENLKGVVILDATQLWTAGRSTLARALDLLKQIWPAVTTSPPADLSESAATSQTEPTPDPSEEAIPPGNDKPTSDDPSLAKPDDESVPLLILQTNSQDSVPQGEPHLDALDGVGATLLPEASPIQQEPSGGADSRIMVEMDAWIEARL